MIKFSVYVAAPAALFAMSCNLAAAGNDMPPIVKNPAAAARGGYEGAKVHWGGLIVGHPGEADRSCLEVVATPLEQKTGKPLVQTGPHEGYPIGQHFFACQKEPLSHSDYATGRLVAVTGTLGPIQERVLQFDCKSVRGGAGTEHDFTPKGCEFHVPVVGIADSLTWVSPPRLDALPPALFSRRWAGPAM